MANTGNLPTIESNHLTVAELIAALSKMPQDAKVHVEGDYGTYQCAGVRQEDDRVYVEIG